MVQTRVEQKPSMGETSDRIELRVDVFGKNIQVTDALRQYATKKVNKLRKVLPRAECHADVALSVVRELQIAEITLHVKGLQMRAEARNEDLYAAIDEAADRLNKQLVKHKARLQRRILADPRVAANNHRSEADEAPGEETVGKVVRTKRFAFKPVDIEEAILNMELLGHTFYVFINAATEQVNVVYRRADGNYGVIEPAT